LNGAKLAGILLEATSAGTGVQALAIGIGVNLIAHPDQSVMEEGALPAVSLLSETGLRITPEAFLAALAPAYARWEAVFTAQGFGPLRAAWLSHAAKLGEMIRAQKEGEGLAKGGQPYQSTGAEMEPVGKSVPTLAQVGISKKLSSRSQAIAAIPEDEFEGTLAEHREQQQAVTTATMEKLTKKGQEVIDGGAAKKGPMIPGAITSAIHRLRKRGK
jgi:hypothetical protein